MARSSSSAAAKIKSGAINTSELFNSMLFKPNRLRLPAAETTTHASAFFFLIPPSTILYSKRRHSRAPLKSGLRWLLHTEDMHPLYRKFGFEEPNYKVMERRPTRNESESG